jgi:hypothetical protein
MGVPTAVYAQPLNNFYLDRINVRRFAHKNLSVSTPAAFQRRKSSKTLAAEARSSQSLEYFLMKNSLLGALSASAVRYPNPCSR